MPSSARLPAKPEPGAGLGLMITINAGCVTLGTPIFGYIVDRTGSDAIAWQVLGAFLTVGSIIGLITLLKDPRD